MVDMCLHAAGSPAAAPAFQPLDWVAHQLLGQMHRPWHIYSATAVDVLFKSIADAG